MLLGLLIGVLVRSVSLRGLIMWMWEVIVGAVVEFHHLFGGFGVVGGKGALGVLLIWAVKREKVDVALYGVESARVFGLGDPEAIDERLHHSVLLSEESLEAKCVGVRLASVAWWARIVSHVLGWCGDDSVVVRLGLVALVGVGVLELLKKEELVWAVDVMVWRSVVVALGLFLRAAGLSFLVVREQRVLELVDWVAR